MVGIINYYNVLPDIIIGIFLQNKTNKQDGLIEAVKARIRKYVKT